MSGSPGRRRRIPKPGPEAERQTGIPATAHALQEMFEEKRVLEKAAANEYSTKVLHSSHPSQPKAKEPHCTHSQLIGYYDANGILIAKAHQYLRPDNSIGASGKPDPKMIYHNGNIHYIDVY